MMASDKSLPKSSETSEKPSVANPVGPGNPPKNTQFKPGHSGNPKGRPKGAKNFSTILSQQLLQKVTITVDGKSKQMTVQEVIVRRLANDSMKGISKATELLIRLTSSNRDDSADKGTASGTGQMPDKDALRRIKTRLDKIVEPGGE